MARSERFELPTLGFEVRCSIQLSYERARLPMVSPEPEGGPDRHQGLTASTIRIRSTEPAKPIRPAGGDRYF
jgi:hypothetical protein